MGPAVDERTAEKDAKGLVAEIYQTIERGQTDSLFSLLSDPIFVFGPRRTDAMLTRSDALVALGKVVEPRAPKAPKPKSHAQLRSGEPFVVTSEGGHSAWVFDTVHVEGQVLAATAILSNTDDIWVVTAAIIAATPAGKQVKAEAARDAVVPPGAMAPARVDPGAEAAVESFKKGLVEQQVWGDDLESRSDAIVVGPSAGDVARGKAAIKQRWKARLKVNVREAINGELTAAMTADARLVWISAPVARVADDEAAVPLRVFAVYEKADAGWKMIALHEALALDEPGSGAAFKKIVPSAPALPEPPKVDADKKPEDKKPDDAAAKKKKKHRSKRKPAKQPKPADDP